MTKIRASELLRALIDGTAFFAATNASAPGSFDDPEVLWRDLMGPTVQIADEDRSKGCPESFGEADRNGIEGLGQFDGGFFTGDRGVEKAGAVEVKLETVLVDEADAGGRFEYVPNIRSKDDEGFEAIQAVLET